MKTITRQTDDFGRLLAHVPAMPDSKADLNGDEPYVHNSTYEFDGFSDPNLVTSRTMSGTHMPLFDIDFPCRLVESQTSGHFHLFIDTPIDEWQFKGILNAFVEAGLVQGRWVNNLEKNGAVGLRLRNGAVSADGVPAF